MTQPKKKGSGAHAREMDEETQRLRSLSDREMRIDRVRLCVSVGMWVLGMCVTLWLVLT